MSITEYSSPIIDRNIFFGNPEISGAQISPDGQFISFIKPLKGTMNIWVKNKEEPFDLAYPVTNDQKRPIRAYFWSRDSKYILYVQDKGGDENFHIYAVDPSHDCRNAGVEGVRDLTPYEDITAFILHLPKADEDLIFVGINDRDKAWHDYYKLRISTGERTLILKNENKFTAAYFDLDSELRVLSRSTDDGGTEILIPEADQYRTVLTADLEENLGPLKFNTSNQLYILSNVGQVNLQGLYLFDPTSLKMTFMESDPEGEVDIEAVSFSELTNELIATTYISDKKRIYWKNDRFESDYNYLQSQFPDSEIDIVSMTKDESEWLAVVSSDTDPGSVYHYERETKSVSFLYSPRPDLPKKDLCRMLTVKYPSIDGLMIPAYLTIPRVNTTDKLPAVIVPHGGPWARDYWGYNSFAQFLANRGYVVLQPNFRGSTGFGKAFLNAAINQWGERMQDDLTAGTSFLVDQYNVAKDKISIMGGSYGGYATLAGLTFTPDIYAAGVSIVGPSNLFTLLDTIPPYWESARVMFHKRMGNPNTDEGKEQLTRQSPFFHADKIKVPLMVAQGANDPRVKKSESDQIVIAMRDHGLNVKYLNFPDEGHGFANPKNNMAFIAAMEKFLAQHIGGRYQKDVSDSIQSIIDNVTVDVSFLEMPVIVNDMIRTIANPEITPLNINVKCLYNIEISIQEQFFTFDILREIQSGNNEIKIHDSSESPMGNMTDTSILDHNLKLIRREVKQDPLHITLENKEGSVKALLKINGKEQNGLIEYKNGFISDGGALDLYLQQLTLKSLDPKTIRVLDAQSQSLKHYLVSGISEEELNGQICRKISIQSLEGPEKKQSLWFSKSKSPLLIQKESNAPEMGGAIIRWQFSHLFD